MRINEKIPTGVYTHNKGGGEGPELQVEELDHPKMTAECARSAYFISGDSNVSPPGNVVSNILNRTDFTLPPLNGVMRIPYFTADGRSVSEPGYDKQTRLWLDLPSDLQIDLVQVGSVTRDEMIASRDTIFDLLRDFPYEDAWGNDGTSDLPIYLTETDASGFPLPNLDRGRGSRVNHLAAIITPHLKGILGAAKLPMFWFEAAGPGEGKGTCCDLVTWISEGKDATKTPWKNEEELEKYLGSLLKKGASHVVFDNLKIPELSSGVLEGAITAGELEIRLLGTNETIEAPFNVQVMATSNETTLSKDMVRRSVPIRLNRKTTADEPEPRYKYNMDDDPWPLKHRAEIIRDIHVMLAWWFQQGVEPGSTTIKTFGTWAKTISGIFEACEIEGFASNVNAFRTHNAVDDVGCDTFLAEWLDWIGPLPDREQWKTATEIMEQFKVEPDGFIIGKAGPQFKWPDLLADYRDTSLTKRLGRYLSKLKLGRPSLIEKDDGSTMKIQVASRVVKGSAQYKVVTLE